MVFQVITVFFIYNQGKINETFAFMTWAISCKFSTAHSQLKITWYSLTFQFIWVNEDIVGTVMTQRQGKSKNNASCKLNLC